MTARIIIFVFLLFANYCFSQTVNDYKAVIIPLKYDFQKTENQYRLQTISKMNLQKAGFLAYYANETIPAEFPDRCSLLYFDVKKENAFLTTKLYIVFKDCYGSVVFQSAIGKSREKEFETAYLDALNNAFYYVYELEYAYNGNTNFSPKSVVATPSVAAGSAPVTPTPNSTGTAPVVGAAIVAVPAVAVSPTKKESPESKISENKSVEMLYAQPTSYGYQLIDSEPKVIMKLYKTSNTASYMAKKGDIQGALVSKENQWFFEYYQNDILVSEKINVKF